MPADMNDYFKKRTPNSGGGEKKPPNSNKTLPNRDGGRERKPISQWIFTAFVIGALFIFLKPFTIINSGEVGIKVRTGKFDETPLKAGLHFYIPVLERIIPVNTRVRLITYSDTHNRCNWDNYSSPLSKGGF